MLFVSVFLAVLVLVTPYRERGDLDHVNEYVDEVLSGHLPRIFRKASLDSNEMSDFYFNIQDPLVEAEVFDGSIRIVCNVVLPRVSVAYRGRFEATTEYITSQNNKDKVQQRNFYSEVLLRNVEAQIELTKLKDNEEPSISNLLILGEGEVTKVFQYNDIFKNRILSRFYVPYHQISGPFYQKCSHIFQKIFYGFYREVLENAFSTVEYPEVY
ncbi:uncharacterized protein TNIN_144971 [Trichonephila inaurata madagascariensis]|uniref:Uncharacterized protein n=1 Tax=Trichonephila inaurata madagascariensis TaxID=2747483 RepID=A0A8X7BPH7_9ARAC|nr:uncharacterized protein TNIN_144971 [Trichonephila inaurata madagascariensis]